MPPLYREDSPTRFPIFTQDVSPLKFLAAHGANVLRVEPPGFEEVPALGVDGRLRQAQHVARI